jgi:hydroxymethylglutaryl-CoA lyase
MSLIQITDVTLREFGQNLKQHHLPFFTPIIRVEMTRALIKAGFKYIEVFSCVSPRIAPAMSKDALVHIAKEIGRDPGATLITLVPNEAGYKTFLSLGLGPEGFNHAMGLFFSAVEAHNLANLGKTIKESLKAYALILDDASRRGITTLGYVSAAFGYKDAPGSSTVRPSASDVSDYMDFFVERGCRFVTLSDLQGVASPIETRRFIEDVMDKRQGRYLSLTGYHPHHSNPLEAVSNSLAALEAGIRRFDASLGGTGGCVTGAPGNQPTELLLEALEKRGFTTGIDLEKVKALAAATAQGLYRKISSQI